MSFWFFLTVPQLRNKDLTEMNIAIEFRLDQLQANGTYNVRSSSWKSPRLEKRLPGDRLAWFWVDPLGEQRSATFHSGSAKWDSFTTGWPSNTCHLISPDRYGLGSALKKHCQRHNGPEGWVHITRSQFTVHKSWTYHNIRISIKHLLQDQHLD